MSALHSAWRWPVAGLLLLIAAVHIPLVSEHLEEARYVGVLFILLSLVCVVLAFALVLRDTRRVWLASGLVGVSALAAFLVSRTVGLPEMADDIGNWTEPLGYPAIAAEVLVAVIATWSSTRTPSAAHRATRRNNQVSRWPASGS